MNNKRGQLAVFVILALVIIVLIIIFMLYPKASISNNASLNPKKFLSDCIASDLNQEVSVLSSQGGYFNPEGYVNYQGSKIKYLCYSSNYYELCSVQQPLLLNNFENELRNKLKPKADNCIQMLKEEYEKKGYSVKMSQSNFEVSLSPKSINLNFISPMTISKESSQSFNKFDIKYDSNIYDLIMISTNIVAYESVYGDSETTAYADYYPDLIIEKKKLPDGTKIYITSDVITNESFRFASRSLVWPPGMIPS